MVDPLPATSPPCPRTRRREWALLAAILLLAGALRTFDLGELPAGLFCDEAALGYNAWAILHHGIDENGVSFPLFVWSFSGYKNPVFIYAATLPIGLFGLSELSVRLTSVLFGLGTVLAVFFLGRRLASARLGLAAAALLTVCPWHLHFSRVAFELISFPLLFVLGLIQLIRFVEGERRLWLGFLLLGSCFYAYAIAKLFVPLFVLGFGLLFLDTVRSRWREWAVAAAVFAGTVAPAAVFEFVHRDRGGSYFLSNSVFHSERPVTETLRLIGHNYVSFLGPKFLFEKGDEMARHAVQDHGELLGVFAPLLLVGAVALLFRRNRKSKLVLLWVALYPVGASLMNEVPSATRGFIGSVAFCVAAAAGLEALFCGVEWVAGRLASADESPSHGRLRAGVRDGALAALTLALVVVGGLQLSRYLDLYVRVYPRYSAAGIGGFQYGYGDLVQFMEPYRKTHRLMWTASDVNVPYIFSLFYRRLDPRTYLANNADPGYLVLIPEEYGRYDLSRPTLYALRSRDLRYFSDLDVLQKVVAPGGQVEFLVAETRTRRNFVQSWLTLGPFPNAEGAGVEKAFVDPARIERKSYAGKLGPVPWRPYSPQFVRMNVAALVERNSGGDATAAVDACEYALVQAEVPVATRGAVEVSGSEVPCELFLNGRPLSPGPVTPKESPLRLEADLPAGRSVLLVKSCRRSGPWELLVRLATPDGGEVPGLVYRAELPEEPEPPPFLKPGESEPDVQVVEGFEGVLSFRHAEPYADYRGVARSWWCYQRDDAAEVSWRTARVPSVARTTFAFTASHGEGRGTAELWVDGAFVLSFDIGSGTERTTWRRGAYRLDFLPRAIVSGNSGIFLLTVPPAAVRAGQPVVVRVVPASSDPQQDTWFMVKDRDDTARHEKIGPGILRSQDGRGPVARSPE